MKELSIEEKARKWYDTNTNEGFRGIFEDIFPELKESDDERIGKEIVNFINHRKAMGSITPEESKRTGSWIAWLEKQYKKDEEIILLKDKIESLESARIAMQECHRLELEKLEKQDEQKYIKTCAEHYNQDNELKMPELSEFENKLADILMYREYDGPDETEDDIAKGRLEYELAAIRLSEELLPLAQKEQKPVDKVEPKFKVGDVIRHKEQGFTCKITAIDTEYRVSECNGSHLPFDSQDYYELVEQKPVEWTMDNIEELTEFENAMMHIGGSFFGEHQGLDPNDTFVVKEQAKILLEMAPKQEWSEEDEKAINDIMWIIEAYRKNGFNETHIQIANNSETWLKSIKDRVPPKQEWSDVDKDILFRIINDLKFLRDTISIDPKYAVNIIDIEREINWLKSFRPQNMWISVDEKVYVQKPVLAQKKDKSDQFKGYVVCCDHTLIPNVYERYMILDNIVSQNTWKPSIEQIRVLSDLITYKEKWGSSHSLNTLRELLEQLKKL